MVSQVKTVESRCPSWEAAASPWMKDKDIDNWAEFCCHSKIQVTFARWHVGQKKLSQKSKSFNIWRARPFSALCFHLVRDVFFLGLCRSKLTFGTELDFFLINFFSPHGVVHQCDQGWRRTPKAMKFSLSFNHFVCHVSSLWKKRKEEKKQADARALYR